MLVTQMLCVEADVSAQHNAAAAEAEKSKSGGVSGKTIFIGILA